MIYLIIGPSCAGKTQLVVNSFIKGSSSVCCYKDLIKVTKTDSSLLIGDYTTNKKVMGTDRISRSQIHLIAPQIVKSFSESLGNVVAEGINICWSSVLDELLPYRAISKLIYLQCSQEISLFRNKQLNPNLNERWFKSVWTRSNNIFNTYSKQFPSLVINTEEIDDFSTFSIDTMMKYAVEPVRTKRLTLF